MSSNTDQKPPKAENLAYAFLERARSFPDQIAFKADGGRGKQYTYGETSQLVLRLAEGLRGGDYREFNEIGLLAENCPEWGLAYLAILAAGRTVVPIDVNLKDSEISYIISHANLQAVFVSARFEDFLGGRETSPKLISFDQKSPQNWLSILADPIKPPQGNGNSVAALIYTSGTTGDPKAVELSHRNLLANLEGIRNSIYFDHHDVFLSVLPLHHTFEATAGFLTPLFSGCTVVYARSLKSREILEDIAYNKATLMCGVPLLYEKMYNSMRRGIQAVSLVQRFMFRVLYALSALGWQFGFRWGRPLFRGLRQKTGLSSIRMFISGGAALPTTISRFFNLIGFDLLQGYGLTECSPVISVNRREDIKFGSVGSPLVNVEVKIYEPNEKGIGEIVVRGENNTSGYRNSPHKNAELLRDGWLFTGDLGKLQDGHLWITGRKKNMIVSAAGKNIYPEQLEERLVESRYVLESIVYGANKKNKQGEEVCAIIVPDLEQFKTDFGHVEESTSVVKVEAVIKDEISRINNEIADYKRITNYQVSFNELEKTSTKKVKRYLYGG